MRAFGVTRPLYPVDDFHHHHDDAVHAGFALGHYQVCRPAEKAGGAATTRSVPGCIPSSQRAKRCCRFSSR